MAKLSKSSIARRLGAGERAQDLLDQAIEDVIACKPLATDVLLQSLPLLLDNGAQMARHHPGSAFERIINAPDVADKAWLLACIMDQLATIDGEVPAHILAAQRPGYLLAIARQDYCDRLPACLAKTCDRGRTPSHFLWDPDSLLTRRATQAEQALAPGAKRTNDVTESWMRKLRADDLAKSWMRILTESWALQQYLQDNSLGLDATDADGLPAWRMCLDRITQGHALLLPAQPICNRAKAYIDAQGMRAQTPAPPAPQQPPRL